MPVVVEVANDGNAHALTVKLLDNRRNRSCGRVIVYSDSNKFRTSLRQRRDLLNCGGNVSGIRIGHGLHHNRCIATNANAIDRTCRGFPALNISHVSLSLDHSHASENLS